MDSHRQLVLINDRGEIKDKTDDVEYYDFKNGKCHVKFKNSSKEYQYNSDNVQIYKIKGKLDPQNVLVFANNRQIAGIAEILDYGSVYRINYKTGRSDFFYHNQITLVRNCLKEQKCKNLFDYFKKVAMAVSLKMENTDSAGADDADSQKTGSQINILGKQYDKISFVRNDCALANYLDSEKKPELQKNDSQLVWPFGLNLSQKQAVENAFSSQISIIEGPPGTGKTQTILNIVANAVLQQKSVAVVASNNSAILNVAEKLEKKGLAFMTALLGSRKNREIFLSAQSGNYPDMSTWELDQYGQKQLADEVSLLTGELVEKLNDKNRVAGLEQELLELRTEMDHFRKSHKPEETVFKKEAKELSSEQLVSLWLEYEQLAGQNKKPGLLKKILLAWHFGLSARKIFNLPPEVAIPYLQGKYYIARERELFLEKTELQDSLTRYSFNARMEELCAKSLRLLKARLAERYTWRNSRQRFTDRDLYCHSENFRREYPVILSTAYSVRATTTNSYLYDFLIIDEASQVDLATGVLAFSCARNVILAGDLNQLPNVLTSGNVWASELVWKAQSFANMYNFSLHSLLSSAKQRWRQAPGVLLREHYRCHPKIIGFCNSKFYQDRLSVMTEDLGEANVLSIVRTQPGNHARGHLNRRQIDVITEEILPGLEREGYHDIAIITPYREQADALGKLLANKYEVDTVHKFQGREKDIVILTSVDNKIGKFADDPKLLNVAVSRAIRALIVVMSQDPENDRTNYGDLARYIEYHNCENKISAVSSVFDLLYREYGTRRREFLNRHGRVSEYDSENLLYAVLQEILCKEEFQKVGCALHVPLLNLIRDYSLLNDRETEYARHRLTHTDFLLFNKMDKSPLLAIEVDGTAFHKAAGSQAVRDSLKNSIFEKYAIPLLRIRTDGSGEKERIEARLRKVI